MRASIKRPIIFACIALLVVTLFVSGCAKREWEKAKKTNTAAAYQGFLAKYPKSQFAADAKTAIEKLEWDGAQKADTVDAFNGYLTKYPTGKFASEAKDKILVLQEKEAITNLAAIAAAEEAYKAAQPPAKGKKKPVYLECKASPAEGGTDANPDAWVDAGGFEKIGFMPSGPVLYKYAVAVSGGGATFTATATGDLDGDGVAVTYTVTNDDPTPVKSPEGEF